ncbi:MAG: ABC transporter permease [Candidatus Brocadiaceae bacterium]|nr:ABC transporter permease [Candidatus Brocadiaceae bacterium]
MVNVSVITRRELGAYFLSPIAYVVLTAFALGQGLLFAPVLTPAVHLASAAQWALSMPVVLMIVGIPLLTMRLLAEETHSGTVETLMTAPVTELEVVLGKFVGAVLFATIMMVPMALEVAYLRLLGPMDAGPLLSGFLGAFLMTSQFIAIGLLCSALTRVQIASAIVSFVLLLGLYFLGLLGGDSSSTVVQVLRYIAPPSHYSGFLKGIVDTRSLAYFVITTVTFLFLTVKALELRKWR